MNKRNVFFKNIFRIPLILALFLFNFLYTCNQSSEPSGKNVQGQNNQKFFDFTGEILFHSNFDGDNEIYKLSKNGVVKLTDNNWNDEYPVWSPDKSKIAFTADPKGHYNIYTMNPIGSRITQITATQTHDKDPSWYPDGKTIAYSQEKKKVVKKEILLYRVNILSKLKEKLLPNYGKTHAIPHVSPTQPLITFTGKRMMGWDVAIYSSVTDTVQFLEERGKSCRARFSRDGKKLAYVSSSADGKGDIWLMNPDGTNKTRLTERDDTYDYFPCWSPDGRYIAFNSSSQHDHNGDWQLYIIEIETKKTILVFDSPGNDVFPDWL